MHNAPPNKRKVTQHHNAKNLLGNFTTTPFMDSITSKGCPNNSQLNLLFHTSCNSLRSICLPKRFDRNEPVCFRMDGASPKPEVTIMKPVLLKAGVPLVLSMVGFVCARIMWRRASGMQSKSSSSQDQVNVNDSDGEDGGFDEHSSSRSLNFTCADLTEDEERVVANPQSLIGVWNQSTRDCEGEEMLALTSTVRDLQERELKLEMQFLRYCNLKERESALMEIGNALLLGMSRLELLDREVSHMEEESKRMADMAAEYFKVMEELHYWKSQNERIHRKVRKLLRKVKQQSRVLRENDLRIEERERETLKIQRALELKTNDVEGMEGEIDGLRAMLDRSEWDKDELRIELSLAQTSAPPLSKSQAEATLTEDCSRLLKEVEQLRTERAVEEKELVYLRWSKACLRHELTKNHHVHEQDMVKGHSSELALADSTIIKDCDNKNGLKRSNSENGGYSSCAGTGDRVQSKKAKILHKLKKWVEGNDRTNAKEAEKAKHKVGCFVRHSVSDDAEEEHTVRARGSCSSA
ncbi:protein CHUP1, chloroplastic isoform X1 [Rhodamnia argentea]|uniref:Protein CHUP1, chloroplastic isoform X1 n=1 Tax=Rhodamnia argentea TaxID=178133 RepID=A0A8B8PJF8_9MYRT|nr:protein CHUP1, chloroplastic isoform X1 [Rhodamnia argentea]